MNLPPEKVGEMLDLLKTAKTLPSTPVAACICKKLLNVEKPVRRHSGVVNYTATLCKDCASTFSQHARIVCLKCKTLVGFVEPYTDKATKFQVLARQHYHIHGCPKCSAVTVTPLLEHVRWCAGRGIPTVDNLDLIQEIEQKRLQHTKDADKLRTSLTDVFEPMGGTKVL